MAQATGGTYHKDAEVDLHFDTADYLDKDTKPDEPWFEHHKKFIDQGVSFFKQDRTMQIMDHPDRMYGNGMSDAEMHNLYPRLYSPKCRRAILLWGISSINSAS